MFPEGVPRESNTGTPNPRAYERKTVSDDSRPDTPLQTLPGKVTASSPSDGVAVMAKGVSTAVPAATVSTPVSGSIAIPSPSTLHVNVRWPIFSVTV